MEKLIYLLGRGPEGAREASAPGAPVPPDVPLRDALLGSAEALFAAGARACTVTAADLDDPLLGELFQTDADGLLSATVSVWVDCLDNRGDIESVLGGLAPRTAGYLATESVPRDYTSRVWADGERSPGVALVTAFAQPERLDDESFFRFWHGSHTPLSLEIHPLTRYIRNTLVRPLTEGAPPYRALVSESVESLEIAADPLRFYGSEEGQKRAVEDFMRFIDMKDMRTVLMSEYILIS